MGNTYEVHSWKEVDGKFDYHLVYSGESFPDAIVAMAKEKEAGVGCVKLEWR